MPVLWERIGKVDLAKANELELPLSVLTPNYVFLNECVWRLILDRGENDNDDAQVGMDHMHVQHESVDGGVVGQVSCD